MTVEEAAADLGIAIPTARTQLKSIFAKTGVQRQAELVAKIMATPLWLSQRIFPSSPSFDAFNRPRSEGERQPR
jgi:hypothetical protein